MAIVVDTVAEIFESVKCGYEDLYSSESIISTVNVGGGDDSSDVSLCSDEHGESGENGEVNVAEVSEEVLKVENEDDVNVGEESEGGIASESKGLVVENVEMESESEVVEIESESEVVESLNGGDGSVEGDGEVDVSVKGSEIEEACDLEPAVDEIEEKVKMESENGVADILNGVEGDGEADVGVKGSEIEEACDLAPAVDVTEERIADNVEVLGNTKDSVEEDLSVHESDENSVPDAQEPTVVETHDDTAVNNISDAPESLVEEVESVCESVDDGNVSVNGVASGSLDDDDNSKNCLSDAQEPVTLAEAQDSASEIEEQIETAVNNSSDVPESDVTEDGTLDSSDPKSDAEVESVCETLDSIASRSLDVDDNSKTNASDSQESTVSEVQHNIAEKIIPDIYFGTFGDNNGPVSYPSYDSRTSWADDICFETYLDNNGPVPYPSYDNKSEIAIVNFKANDRVIKRNNIQDGTLNPMISFGTFEFVSPFSQNDTNSESVVLNKPKPTPVSTSSSEHKPYTDVSTSSSDGFSYDTDFPQLARSEQSNDVSTSSFSQNDINSHSAVLNKPEPTAVSTSSSDGFSHDSVFTQVAQSEQSNDVSTSSVEGSEAGSSERQIINPDLVRRPFYWLVKIPRTDGEKYREDLRLLEAELDEKTKTRNSFQAEVHTKQIVCRKLHYNLQAAISEERVARGLRNAKKREVDSAQSLINLAKSGVTVEDLDSKKFNLERELQHETHTLNEEREIVREIRQLAQQRQQLLANPRHQQEIQQARNQRNENEERLKVLRKESAALRDNWAKADEQVKEAKKKYDDENALLPDLTRKLNAAADIREKAYAHVKTLKEKNSAFYQARNDLRVAYNYAAAGEKASLERHCVSQVAKFMDMWNNNDEFRNEYIQNNQRNMIRKFRTLDGTQLGINEAPQALEDVSNKTVNVSGEVGTSTEVKDSEDKSSKKEEEEKTVALVATKTEVIIMENILAGASDKIKEEEEELARKAEQLRREQDAARLKEQRRLEEKEKAEEALERKRRNAIKAQEKAEFKSRKEAEQKEKRREKRAKRRERMRGLNPDTTENPETVKEPEDMGEPETAKEPEVTEEPEAVTAPEATEKPAILPKRSKKPQLRRKQVKTSKATPTPPVLHSKSKRRFLRYGLYFCVVLFAVAFFFLGGFERIQTVEQHFSDFLHQM